MVSPKRMNFRKKIQTAFDPPPPQDKDKDKDKDKDNDKDKDKDKDKDADRITETLLMCYIFGILMTQAFQV